MTQITTADGQSNYYICLNGQIVCEYDLLLNLSTVQCTTAVIAGERKKKSDQSSLYNASCKHRFFCWGKHEDLLQRFSVFITSLEKKIRVKY